MYKTYQTHVEALNATDNFYIDEDGFQYDEKIATEWIARNIPLPPEGRVLDLCCGDGIWSRAFQNCNQNLDVYGIDISKGGIQKAINLLNSDDEHFVTGDAEEALPFQKGYFDIIFARGPGLYNQHSMDRKETVAVIAMWHTFLKQSSGRFYSIFSSNPKLMDSYTPMEECKLPYNRAPRQSKAVNFSGGKYHHSITTFLQPFWQAKNLKIIEYKFFNNLHYLVTTVNTTD